MFERRVFVAQGVLPVFQLVERRIEVVAELVQFGDRHGLDPLLERTFAPHGVSVTGRRARLSTFG
ncbi:hypothetical protein WL76_31680 [Burkholderia ubonensis]|nr:hypothetical protein WL76_31680 [Burkholderia ubonensis]KWE64559.1 hypothetical protein WL77_19155 [Burkholderia ubonensis]KWE76905.1 hypothetical protein WL79_08670 [Burkholderia ubonensis]